MAPAPGPAATRWRPGIYGNDHLIGEIDLVNTGNVGMVTFVRITWPQEGCAPIKGNEDRACGCRREQAVRFHVSAGNVTNSNVISQLQAWQEGHGYRDGCTYRAAIISAFGLAH